MANGISSGNVPSGVVDLDSSQTLENKNLTAPDIDNGSVTGASIETPSRLDVKQDTFANLETYAASASNGQIVFATDLKQMYQVVDNALVEVGSGGGGINYVPNSDAESGVSDLVSYADAASEAPVDGTGGSPAAVTVSQETSSPLRDNASFKISKAALNGQGEGAAMDFDIAVADQAKVLRISFDYNSSANYADGDIRVYVYDKTNASLIEVIDRDLPGNAQGKYIGEFQSNSDSTSYRLIIHVASTNATAYDLIFDDLQVGPRDIAKGSVVQDWINVGTTTFSATTTAPTKGTVSRDVIRYRRIGDSAEIRVEFTISGDGTNGSGDYLLEMPAGLKIDSSKVKFYTALEGRGEYSTDTAVGYAQMTFGTINHTNGSVTPYNEDYVRIFGVSDGDDVSGSGAMGALSSSWFAFGAGGTMTLGAVFTVPIKGWSANSNISTDFGNRIVTARYTTDVGQSIPNNINTIINFEDIDFDTTAAVTTGGSWKFTAPESGYYDVKSVATLGFTGGDTVRMRLQIYKNDVLHSTGQWIDLNSISNNTAGVDISDLIQLSKGDYIDIRIIHNEGSSLILSGNSTRNYVAIHKIQSPQTLIGSEEIGARVKTAGGQVISATTSTLLSLELSDKDTHSAWNGTAYTAPQTGTYDINAQIWAQSKAWTVGQQLQIFCNINGVFERYIAIENAQATGTFEVIVGSSVSIDMNKGDFVEIFVFHTTTGSLTVRTLNEATYLDIHKR